MRTQLLHLLLASILAGISSAGGLPTIVNLSSYDPKESQRTGRGFTEHDLSAIANSGTRGIIARAGKGGELDGKCANFLAAADREGMHLGIYYRTLPGVPVLRQADQFADRALALAASRQWRSGSLLLCADFDAKASLKHMLRFLDRVEARTGVKPVIYLENSEHLKRVLSAATPEVKARLLQHPYWLALYGSARGGPDVLLKRYAVWPKWTLWQYGGVIWQGGRSVPKVYSSPEQRFSRYLGALDRPVERSVFNGNTLELAMFWARHGLKL
jgi:hypothetical protein